jgi:hypothetical protein
MAWANPAAHVIASPDGGLRAIIMPVDRNKGSKTSESRVEIRKCGGELLHAKSYASSDGEHGPGVMKRPMDPGLAILGVRDDVVGRPISRTIRRFFASSRQKNRIRDTEKLTHCMVLESAAEVQDRAATFYSNREFGQKSRRKG